MNTTKLTWYSLRDDLRLGARALGKHRGYAAIVVSCVALGIGPNAAVFSVINAVLLRPLPFADADRLVMVWGTEGDIRTNRISYPNLEDIKTQNHVFDGIGAYCPQSFTVVDREGPERIAGAYVTADFFSVLGVQPAVGRIFGPQDDRPGANNVAMMSNGFWRSHFGQEYDVIGRTLIINGVAFTVVGVLPDDFDFPVRLSDVGIWTSTASDTSFHSNRAWARVWAVARLKPGATHWQAQAELDAITKRLEQQFPESNETLGVSIVPLHEQIVGDVRPALLLLMGTVWLVLLIACANVANMGLVRGARREQEFALRMVLGAGRLRLIRQLIAESVLTALAGGVIGLLLAMWCLDALAPLIPSVIPRSAGLRLDWHVLAFTMIVTLTTGIFVGLMPALSTTRLNLATRLKTGRTGFAACGRHWTHRILTTAEVSLAVVLLIAAGLFVRSFQRLMSVDPGFDPHGALTFRMTVPFTSVSDNLKRVALYREVRARIAALPGVQCVGASTTLPFTQSRLGLTCSIEGRPAPATGQKPQVAYDSITPGYFLAMEATLRRGRFFTDLDTRERPGVVIINETMARRYWPGEDPLGERITTEGNLTADGPMTFEVVGIVADLAKDIGREVDPKMYVPCAQDPWHSMQFVVRTAVAPLTLVGAIREQVAEITRIEAPYNFATMDQYLGRSMSQRKFTMLLVELFALVALALAAAGIYGVLSYSFSQRTHEIGLRMAIGARRGDVLRLVLGQGIRLTVAGLGIGLVVSLISSGLFSSQLYGITRCDPVTLVGVTALLAAVALAACYAPARRAANIDPLVALRSE